MTADNEKRSFKRYTYKAPIRAAYFNTGNWVEAQTLNHCLEGMCIKSNFRFQPEASILIRVEHYEGNGSCRYTFEALPTVSIGHVKWCREISGATSSNYEVGVKYYAPPY